MMNVGALSEITATYQKYGWLLRRILFRDPDIDALAKVLDGLSSTPEIVRSDIDAAWFSRPPTVGPISWEIRYIGDIPFALLEKLDEHDAGFEDSLSEIEARLSEAIRVKKSALTT